MAIYKKDMVDIDLDNGNLHRSFRCIAIGGGDSNGNEFGIRVFRNNASVSLTGAACVGYFIRPDGITLVFNGTISGNEAKVILPAAAYARAGQYMLTIKVSGTGVADTMRIVDGTVIETTTGTIYDPSNEIPDLEDYLEAVGTAEDAAAAINAIHVSTEQITGTRFKIIVTKDE